MRRQWENNLKTGRAGNFFLGRLRAFDRTGEEAGPFTGEEAGPFTGEEAGPFTGEEAGPFTPSQVRGRARSHHLM